jgi:hypothetical protein
LLPHLVIAVTLDDRHGTLIKASPLSPVVRGDEGVTEEIVLVKPRMSAPFLSDFMEKTSLRVHCRLNVSRRAARPVRPLRGLPRGLGSPRKAATRK